MSLLICPCLCFRSGTSHIKINPHITCAKWIADNQALLLWSNLPVLSTFYQSAAKKPTLIFAYFSSIFNTKNSDSLKIKGENYLENDRIFWRRFVSFRHFSNWGLCFGNWQTFVSLPNNNFPIIMIVMIIIMIYVYFCLNMTIYRNYVLYIYIIIYREIYIYIYIYIYLYVSIYRHIWHRNRHI